MEVGLRDCLKERGLYADLERAVPELYKWEESGIKEAILDVVVRAPCNPRSRWIDVGARIEREETTADKWGRWQHEAKEIRMTAMDLR